MPLPLDVQSEKREAQARRAPARSPDRSPLVRAALSPPPSRPLSVASTATSPAPAT